MRAKRKCYVIAYDISENRRRRRAVKILEKIGTRVNFSVFECMISLSQLRETIIKLEKTIDKRTDSVAIYPICVKCYTKSIYIPERKEKYHEVYVV